MNYLSFCCCRCRNKTLPYSSPSTQVELNLPSPHPLSQTEKPSNITSAVNSAAQSPLSQIPVPQNANLHSKSFTIPKSFLTEENKDSPQKKLAELGQNRLISISNKNINSRFEEEISQKGSNEISKKPNESIEKAHSERNPQNEPDNNEVYTLNQNAIADERTYISSEMQEQIKREHSRLFKREKQVPFIPSQPFSRPPSNLDSEPNSREISIIHSGIRSHYPSQISKNQIRELSHETDDNISPILSRDPSELDSLSNLQHSRQPSNESIPTLSNPVSRAPSLAKYASFMAEPPSAIRESREIEDVISRNSLRNSSLHQNAEREVKDDEEKKNSELSNRFNKKPVTAENSRENSVISAANSISPFRVKSQNDLRNIPSSHPRPKISPGKSERTLNRKQNQLLRNKVKMHEHHSFSDLRL